VPGKKPAAPKTSSSVDRIYEQLKQMAINYRFRPGEPLNEVELAASLGVSRTPLREVLNRLAAEGLLDFVPRRGFSCRPMETKMIFDLYELRCGLEIMSTKLATERATDAELDQLTAFWKTASSQYGRYTPIECAQCDEAFHEQIATLSRNAELVMNARAHYLRLISMEQETFRHNTCDEHQLILTAMQERNAESAATCMSAHVSLRQEQLVKVIKEAIARLYMV
jgi:DNA-binding GntR family transcriptional regulator